MVSSMYVASFTLIWSKTSEVIEVIEYDMVHGLLNHWTDPNETLHPQKNI